MKGGVVKGEMEEDLELEVAEMKGLIDDGLIKRV